MSGYYEGATYKDEYHANLWTSSRLSDYQGFSASSPEYGFRTCILMFSASA